MSSKNTDINKVGNTAHVRSDRKGLSPYLRLTQEELQEAIDRGKADFEKSGYETIEEYARSLRK